ncbi:hypothetical protein [Mesobacillus zeae]|uniref:hypothetical protein n=1 Tax=Mesobacillus zeae TaxID=1917180 RepID=UPI0030082991
MKPGMKIASGIFTSLATISLIFIYDFYIQDRIDSTEVVVVKAGEKILKSEQITEDKLVIERRGKEALIDGIVLAKDLDKVIGQDSKQDIVGNSMISTKMVDYDQLIPDASKGEAIRPITKNMIYAQPGSLRRKDVIDIYLVNNDGTTNWSFSGPSKVDSKELTPEEILKPRKRSDIVPFLKGVKVVYVKDAGNKEVVAAPEEKNNSVEADKRLNGTSTISDLEVILNEKDFSLLMDQVVGRGAKLYITYQ